MVIVPWWSAMIPFTSSRNKRSREAILLLNISAFTVVALSSYWSFCLVRRYGWEGAMRYIWEGDALPRDIREYINTLNNASIGLEEEEKEILSLEEGLQRAHFDTVDESSPSAVLDCWRMSLPLTRQDIRGLLSKTSAALDKLAAEIDQVPNKDLLRQEKKDLSSRVVSLMARVDVLIDFFKQATNERFKL
jgi:hypothetical protein